MHQVLDQSFAQIDVFKHALNNSFKINFLTTRRTLRSDEGKVTTELFHYLGEVDPFLRPRVASLSPGSRRAYFTLFESANEAFWSVYSAFLPLVNSRSTSSGVAEEELEPILGRAILLFDASRHTRFITYLDKTLRESLKNLRGKHFSRQLQIPLSAGRLVPQILWELDQASMLIRRSLTREESDDLIIEFLSRHRCRFAESTMIRIASVLRAYRSSVSFTEFHQLLEPSFATDASDFGNDQYVDDKEQREFELKRIHQAMDRAEFDLDERTLLLQRLDLTFDPVRYEAVASGVTPGTLRKRKTRLLVRLMAARYADRAPRFGPLLLSKPAEARKVIQRQIACVAEHCGCTSRQVIEELLNWMALSDSVYRISIAERGKIQDYLGDPPRASLLSPVFQKLKAALIEQERLDFPFVHSL